MDQKERKPTPVGAEAPKSPAERVRLIQEMQAQADRAAAQPAPVPSAPQQKLPAPAVGTMAPAAPPAPSNVPDAFRVNKTNAIATELANKTRPTEAMAYARAAQSTSAIFGGSNDLEVLGNPWKVIPFGDSLPALFDDVDAAATPKLPNQAVKLDGGSALFEVGVLAKGGEAVAQKRAVLVDSGGKLLGAECKTAQDATRLFSKAAHLLPENVRRPNTTWKVTVGQNSAFTLEIERGAGKVKATERLPLDNFGRIATNGRRSDIVVANYYLDRFEAAV